MPAVVPRVRRVAASAFAAMLAYAVVRYHLFGGVPWSQFPLYTTNKALAFTAAVLLCIAALNRGRVAGAYGTLGYAACLAHAVASLAMLSPGMYPKFFDGDRLGFTGQLAVLAGIGAVFVFALPACTSFDRVCASLGSERVRCYRRLCTAALLILGAHLVAMGAPGWLDPSHWPGTLPPITLLSTAVIGGAILVRVVRRRRSAAFD